MASLFFLSVFAGLCGLVLPGAVSTLTSGACTVLKLFNVRGIPIAAHWSLLVAVALFAWRAGSLVAGLIVGVLVFASVLLHELGHSLVALRLRLPITGIDLTIFGGAAKLGAAPRSPREELLVAVAGPLVSLALAAAGFGLAAVAPASIAALASFVGSVNLGLFVFNLLPALPMDGGRVLRAILASRLGFVRGTTRAVQVGTVAAVVVGAVGFATDPWLLVLTFVIWSLGRGELAHVERSVALDRLGLGGVDPWARYRRSARDSADRAEDGRSPDVVVLPDGRAVTLH